MYSPAILGLVFAACSPSPKVDDSAVELAACICGDGDSYPPPCEPVHTDRCTDCDCDGYTIDDDCDDENWWVHPGQPECGPDGVDGDCDGVIDEVDLPEERCDGIDDNCNSQIDEGLVCE